jgi:hypothetical protein
MKVFSLAHVDVIAMEDVHGLTFYENVETETRDMTTAENKRGKDEMKVDVTRLVTKPKKHRSQVKVTWKDIIRRLASMQTRRREPKTEITTT